MNDFLWFIVFLAGYILLTQWVLPRLGVPT